MVLPLRTEIDSESSPAPASMELLARVRAATTVSLAPAAAIVALVAPLERSKESAPSAKVTLMSLAVEPKTTESAPVSSVDADPLIDVFPTTLLKVRMSEPLPPTKVEFVTVPVSEKRSSPCPAWIYVLSIRAVTSIVSLPLFPST